MGRTGGERMGVTGMLAGAGDADDGALGIHSFIDQHCSASFHTQRSGLPGKPYAWSSSYHSQPSDGDSSSSGKSSAVSRSPAGALRSSAGAADVESPAGATAAPCPHPHCPPHPLTQHSAQLMVRLARVRWLPASWEPLAQWSPPLIQRTWHPPTRPGRPNRLTADRYCLLSLPCLLKTLPARPR